MARIGSLSRTNTFQGFTAGPAVLIAKDKTIQPSNASYGIWATHNDVKALGPTGWDIEVWANFADFDMERDHHTDLEHCYIMVKVDGYHLRWINRNGLIYTNTSFERAVRRLLQDAGIPGANSIGYTEQGMQGDNFVSMCAGKQLSEWLLNTYGDKLGINVAALNALVREINTTAPRQLREIKKLMKKTRLRARTKATTKYWREHGDMYFRYSGNPVQARKRLKELGFEQQGNLEQWSDGPHAKFRLPNLDGLDNIQAIVSKTGISFSMHR
jgi:hypothetical protein